MKRRVQVRPQHWPAAIPDRPDEYDFVPSHAEKHAANELSRRIKLLARLEEMRKQWIRDDDKRRRERLAEIGVLIERDRAVQALEDQREEMRRARMAEIEKVKAYYEGEHKKELEALKKRVAQLGKVIARDAAKAEREKLLARGLVRGRRNK